MLYGFAEELETVDDDIVQSVLSDLNLQSFPQKETLEEVRMLSNFQADAGMPLQIFLVGQPELRTILRSPGMHQIRQRIAFNYHLNGLSQEETRNYIEYRLKKAGADRNPFTPEAVELVFQSTTGIPRSINVLCDSALLYGFAEEVETVDADIVKSVLSDLNLQSFPQKETLAEPIHPEEQPAAVVRQTEISPTGNPGNSNRDDLIKKVFVVVKKQLDKIDVKIDLLRDEVLKKVNGSLNDERKRYEDLLIEHTKIKSELERINFSEKNL